MTAKSIQWVFQRMFAYHFSSSVVCVVNLHKEEKLSLDSLNNCTVCIIIQCVCVCVCVFGGTYRISSILLIMFSAYERSRSRVTRSLILSWSSLDSSPSATVRPILRFCLHEQMQISDQTLEMETGNITEYKAE